MARLTHRLNGMAFFRGTYSETKTRTDTQGRTFGDAVDKLARYEDLEEAGRLVELPCALGTTVWTTKWWDDVTETVKVDGKKFHRQVMKHKVTKTKFSLYDFDDFGKTVFLTREEAEAALKGGGQE